MIMIWVAFALGSCGDPEGSSGEEALSEALARAGRAESAHAARAVSHPRSDGRAYKELGEVVYTIGLDTPREQAVSLTRRLALAGETFHLEVLRQSHDARRAASPHEDGWELISDGRRAASRRRAGPWLARSAKEASTLTIDSFDDFEALVKAFDPWLTWRVSTAPSAVATPEPHHWFEPVLRDAHPTVAREPGLKTLRWHEGRWDAWLAGTHQLTSVSGRVARRDSDQRIVSASLTIRGRLRLDDVSDVFLLRLTLRRDTLSPEHRFAVPTQLTKARRDRPWFMIEDVLGDALRSPYRGSD